MTYKEWQRYKRNKNRAKKRKKKKEAGAVSIGCCVGIPTAFLFICSILQAGPIL